MELVKNMPLKLDYENSPLGLLKNSVVSATAILSFFNLNPLAKKITRGLQDKLKPDVGYNGKGVTLRHLPEDLLVFCSELGPASMAFAAECYGIHYSVEQLYSGNLLNACIYPAAKLLTNGLASLIEKYSFEEKSIMLKWKEEIF